MPYMGVGIFDGNNKIIIKIHGPLEITGVISRELRECAGVIWDNNNTKGYNIPARVQILANELKNIFCDGADILWVQVEYQSPSDGSIFGASAERVLDEAA